MTLPQSFDEDACDMNVVKKEKALGLLFTACSVDAHGGVGFRGGLQVCAPIAQRGKQQGDEDQQDHKTQQGTQDRGFLLPCCRFRSGPGRCGDSSGIETLAAFSAVVGCAAAGTAVYCHGDPSFCLLYQKGSGGVNMDTKEMLYSGDRTRLDYGDNQLLSWLLQYATGILHLNGFSSGHRHQKRGRP